MTSHTEEASGNDMIGSPTQKERRIAICLSGGGFRATFFHLGVLAAIRDANALGCLKKICSVSGGSITAAHLVACWVKYSGADADFAEAGQCLKTFGELGLRNRMLRRWLLAVLFVLPRALLGGRTYFLEREYERLFGSLRFHDIYQNAPKDTPDLEILSTSFTTGDLCSFSKRGFARESAKGPILYRTGLVLLRKAVAISSAFPPLFPPILITRQSVAQGGEGDFDPNEDLLADGGVFDNLGVQKYFLIEARNELTADILIVSDAGAKFDWRRRRKFKLMFQRAVRASDIMMFQMAGSVLIKLGQIKSSRVAVCSIAATTPDDEQKIDIAAQQQLPFIRTDLDRFSLVEIESLITHGYQICRRELTQIGLPTVQGRDSLSLLCNSDAIKAKTGAQRQRLVDHLCRSSKRAIRPFELSDLWPTATLFATAVAILAAAATPPATAILQRGIIADQRKLLLDAKYLCRGVSVFKVREDGWTSVEKEDYSLAKSIATTLRECNASDAAAYNIFASTAFLTGDYDNAVSGFDRADELQPDRNFKLNLADSLVELSLSSSSPDVRAARLRRAVELYKNKDADDETNYKIAKAYFYDAKYEEAERYIKLVPTKFEYENGRGKARILESAVLFGEAKITPAGQSEQLAAAARIAFSQGYTAQAEFWSDVFLEGKKNPKDPYDEIVRRFGDQAKFWLRK